MKWLKGLTVFVIIFTAIYSIYYKPNYNPQLFIDQIKAQPPGRIEPLPELPSGLRKTIAPNFLKNPFVSKTQVADSNFPALNYKPNHASILQIEHNRVLIQLSDNAAYWVKSGDTLWKGEVTILSIEPDGVKIKFTSGETEQIKIIRINKI